MNCEETMIPAKYLSDIKKTLIPLISEDVLLVDIIKHTGYHSDLKQLHLAYT